MIESLLKRVLNRFHVYSEGVFWYEQYETTEEGWEKCQSPEEMLWALRQVNVRDEKAHRLFHCWCIRNTCLLNGRSVWDLLRDKRCREAVEVSERFAQGQAVLEELEKARIAAGDAAREVSEATTWAVGWSAWTAVEITSYPAWKIDGIIIATVGTADRAAQANALRHFFGNPFVNETILLEFLNKEKENSDN